MRDNVVLVAVDQASFHFDKLYSYRLPPSAGEVTRGCRVLVPFGGGNRPAAGHRGAHRHGGGTAASSPSPRCWKGNRCWTGK